MPVRFNHVLVEGSSMKRSFKKGGAPADQRAAGNEEKGAEGTRGLHAQAQSLAQLSG